MALAREARTADVAVVGAGVVGTAAAAMLAGAGARVVVVESVGVASAASGRNSGVVQHPFDPVLARLYRETVSLLRDLQAVAPDRFSLPAQPAGLLYVGEDAAAARRLADGFAASHPDLAPAFLEGRELQALEPTLAPDLAACRLEIGYPVGPARVTEAWAALARDRGADVRVGEAGRLDLRADRVTGIITRDGAFHTGAVIVAAGPWTPAIVDPTGTWRPIRPLWGAVAEVEVPAAPRHVLEELEIDATIEPDGTGEGKVPIAFSLVTAEGRSVVGSTFTFDERDDVELAPALLARARRFVPGFAAARVAGTRRCARPLSLDGRPLLGAVPGVRGLYVAAGHGPWGISTGAASARLVADLVLGRAESPPSEVDPGRFDWPGARPQRQLSGSNR